MFYLRVLPFLTLHSFSVTLFTLVLRLFFILLEINYFPCQGVVCFRRVGLGIKFLDFFRDFLQRFLGFHLIYLFLYVLCLSDTMMSINVSVFISFLIHHRFSVTFCTLVLSLFLSHL